MFLFALTLLSTTLLLFVSVYGVMKGKGMGRVALPLVAGLLAAGELIGFAVLRYGGDPAGLLKAMVIVESLLPAVFVLFSLGYSRKESIRAVPFRWKAFLVSTALFPAMALSVPASGFFYSPDLVMERMLFLGGAGFWFYLGMVVYLTVALMNVERTFLAANRNDREKLKLEFIGISGMLGVLIFYYSQALIYRSISMNLAPVRSGVFVIAALLIAYSKMFVGNGVKVSVSRYIIYRSVTLTLIGTYLLVLGLTGEGMRYVGVPFSRDLTVFVGFAAGMLVLSVIMSRRLRRRMKVFINANFFAHKYDYRVEWLRMTARLAACRSFEGVQDAIITTYRDTFGLNGACLYLIDDKRERYTLAMARSMEPCGSELDAGAPLISYFAGKDRVYDPHEREYVPAKEEAEFLRGVNARLLVPLIVNGAVEGFVAFGEQLAPEDFVYEDYDMMKTLARQAALAVINFRLSEEITETREVAAVGRISSFVVHDLKNMASSLAMTAENAGEYMQDPEFQADMLSTMKGAVAKMNGLIKKLKTPGREPANKALADIDVLARGVVESAAQMGREAKLSYSGRPVYSVVDAEEIKSVMLNLILNAFEALDGAGEVEVETGEEGGRVFIRVRDNGRGMSRDFMDNHLFKPFRTTKKKGFGIGLYQCRQIIEAHGGRCQAESREGEGSLFTVWLPMAKEVAHA